ncbi:MAG: MFS transporter [Deltaproteobacteria bacterium]|nr:MAG: MFS transporter [Deltaproteobacteria bacterium]
MAEKRRSQFFYGYLVVAGCFAIQGTGIGAFYTFGIFFKEFLAEFGWSRAAISAASSGVFLLAGLLGIVVGNMNDRFGPRLIMAVTGSSYGLGLLLMSQLSAIWQLYVFYSVIVGIGLSSVDVIPLTTTARWFVKRRGMMTGIVKVGTGTGQLIMPLMSSVFIAAYGWRTSYILLSALVFLLMISSGQLLRRDPGQKGLLPDGEAKTSVSDLDLPEQGVSLGEAALTRQFWMICVIYLLIGCCLMTVVVHIVPHATDLGISPIAAAGILSTIGGVSMVGRLVTGIAIDRVGTKKLLIVFFLILIASLLWVQVSKELWMFYVFGAIYALGHGGFFTVISPIIAELFGISSHGVLFGIASFGLTVGGSIGPTLAGYVFDVIHSYQLVFFILAALAVAGVMLTLLLRPVITEP